MAEEKEKITGAAKSNYVIPLAILIAGLIVGGAIVFGPKLSGNSGSNAQNGGNTPPTQAVNIKDVNLTGEPYIGNPNAPVTIAYWSDYQCPFCQRFETQTLPTLKSQYVDAGKVRIVFKDLQFLGPDSQTAALLGRAIWSAYPDKYFDWRQKMYEEQGAENSGWVSAKADKIASSLGMDVPKLNNLISQNKSAYEKAIADDSAEAAKFGITSTPSFIVGNQLIVGAEPLTAFTQAITSGLGK